jgi:FAD/FMN-containing dehydrogenase
VQFQELYVAAQQAGRLVIGGTCDSVSVGGCWLGGCYGSFSRVFGSGAANLLELRLVLVSAPAEPPPFSLPPIPAPCARRAQPPHPALPSPTAHPRNPRRPMAPP